MVFGPWPCFFTCSLQFYDALHHDLVSNAGADEIDPGAARGAQVGTAVPRQPPAGPSIHACM
jgi:hypothetical protein